MAAGLLPLCLLLPALVLLVRALTSMPVDLDVTDDVAVIELSTLRAASGEQLLGPYSRFGFHHPGPLMFYLLVPFFLLGGRTFAGLSVGALSLNLVWLAGMCWVLGRIRERLPRLLAFATAASFVLYLGPLLLMSAWNPDIAIMPLAFALLASSEVLAGRSGFLPAITIAASLAAQSHLSFALPAFVALLVSFAGLVLGPGRAQWAHPAERRRLLRHIGLALVLGVVVWLPTLVELTTNGAQNLTQILHVLRAKDDGQPWMAAIISVVTQSSAFLIALLGVQATTQVSAGVVGACGVLSGLQVFLLVLCVRRGWQNRDRFQLASCFVGLVLLAVGVASTRGIKGLLHPYLNRWLAAAGLFISVTLISVLGAPRWPARLRTAASAAAGFLGLALVTVSSWHAIQWSIRASLGEAWSSRLPSAVLQTLTKQGVRQPHVRILHNTAWPKAAGIMLACTRAGLQPTVDGDWEFMFGEDATCRTTGDEVVLVTRSADAATLERSPGVVSLASEDGITVLGARISQGPLATLELGGVAAELYLRSGFSGPERDEVGSFRWNDGDESRLVLPASPGRSMQLSLLACPVVVSGEQQQLSVELNGAPVGTWTMRPQWDSYSIVLPARLVREQNLLTFKYSLVIRPNDYGRSGDTRKLAVRFRSLTCKETGAT